LDHTFTEVLDPLKFRNHGRNTPPAKVFAARNRTQLHSNSPDCPTPPPWWTRPKDWGREASLLAGKLRYKYYNWRKDAGSDLIVAVAVNSVVLLLGAGLDRLVSALHTSGADTAAAAAAAEGGGGGGNTDGLTGTVAMLCQAWQSLYHVVVLSFGENFPEVGESLG
jgi:hypothetical protein